MNLTIDDTGHLRLDVTSEWREPICSACGESIQWVLDMMSFAYDHGGYTAQHARCAWTRGAFDRQRALAKELDE